MKIYHENRNICTLVELFLILIDTDYLKQRSPLTLLCYNVNLNCNYSAHTVSHFVFGGGVNLLTLLFRDISRTAAPTQRGLYCSEPSLRKFSQQLPANIFSSPPPPTSMASLPSPNNIRTVLLLLHALSWRLNSCITNPFPICLAIIFYSSLSLCLYFYLTPGSPS